MLEEAGGEALAFGPVHLAQSSPLGQQGTSVIAAHRDTHFKALAHLEKGALVTLEPISAPPVTYRIETMRIAPWDQSGLMKEADGAQLALTSCWPFDALQSSPLRFIAQGRQYEGAAVTSANATIGSQK